MLFARSPVAFLYEGPYTTIDQRLGVLESAPPSESAIDDAILGAGINYALFPGTIGYALGDSTVAAYLGQPSLISLVSTIRTPVNIATPGDIISGQKSKWQALTIDTSLVGWVVVQIGLNDLSPGESASVAISRLQDLILTVRASIGSRRKLLVSKMLPARQRLIDLYGDTNGPISQQKWVDINAAIAGAGPSPITGVDVPLLDDGSGNLAAAYDTGDHIHPNAAGRQIMADAWKTALVALRTTV